MEDLLKQTPRLDLTPTPVGESRASFDTYDRALSMIAEGKRSRDRLVIDALEVHNGVRVELIETGEEAEAAGEASDALEAASDPTCFTNTDFARKIGVPRPRLNLALVAMGILTSRKRSGKHGDYQYYEITDEGMAYCAYGRIRGGVVSIHHSPGSILYRTTLLELRALIIKTAANL
ncbi:hypothetical protein GCM10023116_48520 [Kistimonas scapharcae]|uniref:Antirepressor protein C-terminal domain-containing protein n=1 Tax=Kistimonas scapharcae TaxID=1036133 RepID=A0ABP8VAI0_9GAMM